MTFSDMQIKSFIDVLASDAPAPGGGSVAALSGALGMALTSMVANLTTGKKKYEEHQALINEILAKSLVIRTSMLYAIEEDIKAFNQVSDVFAMPKDTEAEKAEKDIAMDAALKKATLVPLDLMSDALTALKLTQMAIGKSNKSAVSDLGVAALSLKTACLSAWLNIKINLSWLKDQSFIDEYGQKGEAILKEATTLADDIYNQVLNSL